MLSFFITYDTGVLGDVDDNGLRRGDPDTNRRF